MKSADLFNIENSSLNQGLIQTLPFGMDLVRQDGTLFYLSPQLEAVAGKEAVGRKCWEVYKDDKKQCEHCPLKA